jgi:hypothetical protein
MESAIANPQSQITNHRCLLRPVGGQGVPLLEPIRSILSQVQILARRLSLATPGVRATAPMLRGVWGAALHDLDPEAYNAVFAGAGSPHERVPPYVLRPAPPSVEDWPAIDWVLMGKGLAYDAVLLRAWDVASGMGLGPGRHRFHIRALRPLGPAGDVPTDASGFSPWSLLQVPWPLPTDPLSTPCRLSFAAPLRLIRNHRLVEQPTLTDIVVATVRRLAAFLPSPAQDALTRIRPGLIELSRKLRAMPWEGERLDLVRYSGRQKRELQMRGVSGHLDLPDGPGSLWPLLAAAQWLHIGKGTVVGMGQLVVQLRPRP